MGKLFVISGPSGVGKGTVFKAAMARRGDIRFSVSATTRPPREEDIPGVTYDFVTVEEFESLIARDALLEYSHHHGTYYGTPLAQLEAKRETGHVILDIDPNGAFAIRQKRPDAVLIFIMPPSLEELERRLRSRPDDTLTDAKIRERLSRAPWEMAQAEHYDHVVVNDDAMRCTQEILQIIAQEADR